MDFLVTFDRILMLFIMMVAGYFIKKLKIVDMHFSRNLSNFLFNVTLPAMIISSMNFPFTLERLATSGKLLLYGILFMSVSGFVSFIAIKYYKTDPLSRNVYQLSILISNFAFMGYPVIEALFGKEGVFFASIFNVPVFFVVNSFGVMIISRGDKKGGALDFKKAVNAPMVALVAGFIMFVCSIKLPYALDNAVNMVGNTTTPLSLILSGILLANADFKAMFGNYKVYITCAIRLIGMPVLMLLVLRTFVSEPIEIGIPVIIAAMPVAANVSILSERYGGNSMLGAQCVFLSTLLSVLTIPLIVALL